VKKNSEYITVILDDDPTGTQTVHNVTVLTAWDLNTLIYQFRLNEKCFFILTNSRAFTSQVCIHLLVNICNNIRLAALTCNKTFNIILRGDSTLRGHFPEEPLAVEQVMGSYDKWLLCPFFEEGGRITLNDTHYLREDGRSVPVSETQFAKDPVFGYRNSNLKKWIEEKTNGGIKSQEVGSLESSRILNEGEQYIIRMLQNGKKVWIVNASSMEEVRIVASACKRVEMNGISILYRSAASFVQAYLEIEKKSLLSADDIRILRKNRRRRGGLIVVGSFVSRTTEQLLQLLQLTEIHAMEVKIDDLAGADQTRIRTLGDSINTLIASGETVALYTSRESKNSNEDHLTIGAKISEGLVQIVKAIKVRPGFLIAKGGITSSDIATKSLEVRRARVLGQAMPGVPVWILGPESKFPNLPYVVFPGNVGSPDAMKTLVSSLLAAERKITL
jgi:uncharacterized protein YgbK (DUF1537 family)